VYFFSELSLYDSNKDFKCLDGSQSIPFSHINDDYCDCVDGTDEPGMNSEFVLIRCCVSLTGN
jgi:protein kinase C substrate 80K-H